MEKMDARKRYTQMVLKQSFLTLLKERPVNKITVKDVCALAQLKCHFLCPLQRLLYTFGAHRE